MDVSLNHTTHSRTAVPHVIDSKFLFVLLTSLYFSQGFPSGLLAHAMPAIMREYGASHSAIGMLKLLALPWLFKFLWAPMLDRYYYRPLGPHCSWILVMQTGAIATLIVMSLLSPGWLFEDGLVLLFILLCLLNVFSSTQDVATDGLAVSLLSKKLRGLGNSIQVVGYKAGLMLGGSGLLVLMNVWGWNITIQLVAATLVVMLIPTLLFKEHHVLNHTTGAANTEVTQPGVKGVLFWEYFKIQKIGFWLLVILTYKLADGMSSTLVKSLLIDQGMTLADVGQITFVSSLASLIGAIFVGILYRFITPIYLLLVFAVLQMATISAYSLIPGLDSTSEHYLTWVYWIVTQDQLVDTMSTVVLFAIMMGHCRKQHEGGDYTLQACIQVFSAGLAGALGGVVADALNNYTMSFLVAAGLGVFTLISISVYIKKAKNLNFGNPNDTTA